MGVRSVNNSLQQFLDTFVRSGTDAATPYREPQGHIATGGIISDYSTPPGAVYRAHVFTGSGTFTVTSIGTFGSTADILVVGGGGGGGGASYYNAAGGGGGGGVVWVPVGTISASPGSYTVTVGGGGSRTVVDSAGPLGMGLTGSSSFFGPPSPGVAGAPNGETGYGGAGGGVGPSTPLDGAGGAGGSGGGGSSPAPGGPGAGGTKSQPVTNIFGTATPYGNNGGSGYFQLSPDWSAGGGGGGAGGVGGNSSTSGAPGGNAGVGGSGVQVGAIIDGTNNYYWAGGGGGGIGINILSPSWPSFPPASPPRAVNVGTSGTGGTGGGGSGAISLTGTVAVGGTGGLYVGGTAGPKGDSDQYKAGKGGDGGSSTGGGGGGAAPKVGATFLYGFTPYNTYPNGGAGGSGIVVVRYQIAQLTATQKATGGLVSFYGGKTIHAFVGSGTFTVTNPSLTSVETFVVAGGGAGGDYQATPGPYTNAGGGAGGIAYNPSVPVSSSPGAYTITVGAGSAGINDYQSGVDPSSVKGSNSTAFGITAVGGGGGSQILQDPASPPYTGGPGGSGGGGAFPNAGYIGGTGTQPSQSQPPGTTNYGYDGGNGTSTPGPQTSYVGGGGGGAGGVGGNSNTGPAAGGPGIQAPPSFRNPAASYGTPGPNPDGFYFGGGGGGGSITSRPIGGGGYGGPYPTPQGIPGIQNTGGGGGGNNVGPAGDQKGAGGAGGSGIVLIAYPS